MPAESRVTGDASAAECCRSAIRLLRYLLQAQICLPDLRHSCEHGWRTPCEHAALGDDVGIIAHRECEMHVLLDRRTVSPASFNFLSVVKS
jgi:hypothetical protein